MVGKENKLIPSLRPVEFSKSVEGVEVAFGLLDLRNVLKGLKWPLAC